MTLELRSARSLSPAERAELNNGLSGQIDGPSSYLMKSPMHQRPDDEARELTEAFIAKYHRTPEKASPTGKRAKAKTQA